MFPLTNKLPNQDDVLFTFTKGASLASGRWGLDILETIFPNYSMPWIYGVITIVLITICICIVLEIFHLKHPLVQILLAGCIMTIPSQVGTMIFIFTAAPYALSLMLSLISVWLLRNRPRLFFPLALLSIVLSLGIYQAYIAIAASFLVLILIQDLMEGKDLLDCLKQGLLYLTFLILSLGIYYGVTEIIKLVRNIQFSRYVDDHLIFSFADLPQNIITAYRYFLDIFREYQMSMIPNVFSLVMHLVALAAAALLFLLWFLCQDRREPLRFLFLCAMAVLLPLAINCMYLFSVARGVHALVLYSFIALYVLIAIGFEGCTCNLAHLQYILKNIVSLTLPLIIATNLYFSNEVFLALHFRYENAYAFYTTLMSNVKSTPGYTEDTQLALIGGYEHPEFYYEKFPFTYKLFGANGFRPDSDSKQYFMEYYIGIEMPLASKETMDQIQLSEEFSQMATYPYYGSMQMFDDTLVVKLS